MFKNAVIVLIILPILCYSPTLFSPFLFDDLEIISQLTKSGVPTAHLYRSGFYHLFDFIGQFSNWNPFAFHLFNLLAHICSCLLIFFICKKMFPGQVWLSFFASALFGVHPINTEAVTYISGMATSVSTLFCFASIYLYLQSRFAFAFACFVFALLFKETAIILPVLILLIDCCFVDSKQQKIKRLIFFVPALFLFISLFFTGIGKSFISKIDLSWLLVQAPVIPFAFKMIVFPVNQNFDYDVLPKLLDIRLFLLLLLALTANILKSRSVIIFGIAWFIIAGAPTNSVIPRYDLLSERNLYLPSFGIIIMLLVFLRQCIEKKYILPLGLSLVILFAMGTINRNLDYRSGYNLWQDTLNKSPRKYRVINNRNYYYNGKTPKQTLR